jgi:chromosome segregation ATPase
MASEPTDESVSVSLPSELAEWVDEQASERDVDRETVLVQFLAAHRATQRLEDGTEVAPDDFDVDIEGEVREIIADRMSDIAAAVANEIDVQGQVQQAVEVELEDAVADAVDAQLDAKLDDAMTAEIEETIDDAVERQVETALSRQIGTRIDDLEDEFMAKIEDVRERVVNVAKKTNRNAPADHDHPDLTDRINGLAADVEAVQDDLEDLRDELAGHADSQAERLDDLDETVWDMQEKLETVAWVVNDLRDSTEMQNKRATSVEKIKQSAAKADVDRAACEACGEGVEIALLTDPECPHCQAAVTHVEPADGFFGNPHLVKAQGIEAANGGDDT